MLARLATLLCALCLSGTADADEWSGVWRYDACEDPGEFWVIGAGAELIVNEDGFQTGPIRIAPDTETVAGWTRLEDARDRVYFAKITRNQMEFLDLTAEARLTRGETASGTRVFPDAEPDPETWDKTVYRRCEDVPTSARALFGELSRLMLRLDGALDSCDRRSRDCMENVFAAFDVVEDDGLSIAEVARIARAATLFSVGFREVDPTAARARLERLSSIAAAPDVAASIVASFDYDGNARLSIDELGETGLTDLSALLERTAASETDADDKEIGLTGLPAAAAAFGALVPELFRMLQL
ncbi:MAG: hypothetical protein AAFR35_12620 [Pseudomonadota bacterium]